MDIQDLRIFTRVAAMQNLSAVGTEMSLTPGTISKRLQALEDELSVRLFDRTTRSIRITEEGALFLEHVDRILAELELARASVDGNVKSPRGKLKISAPVHIGGREVGEGISSFMRQHPEIEIHAELTDRNVSLQEEGFDVAIKTGVLADSALIAKRLATNPHVIAASQVYLDKHGVPKTPNELERHCCLVHGEDWAWPFARRNAQRSVRVTGRLRTNDDRLLMRAALDGHGLIRVSSGRVRSALADGRLRTVLEDYDTTGDSAVWAVYPRNRHMLPRLRSFVDFFAAWTRAAVDEDHQCKDVPVSGDGGRIRSAKENQQAAAPQPTRSKTPAPARKRAPRPRKKTAKRA
ncbi:putative Transcriptional regulator, LysR family [Candidatus Filomicrobium marinum]|uniref:Putative Transcriptional regulator, LysR family n=1 Tax=Candidatus Filomicrobium marinum TaxID=1608628 RepID=A0A0D6JD18_9HYPH|nr:MULTISPECIES: LysR family transcriptional regulator [Filomicrobium]MCV0368241.1 LysR family transcriptional regulator [Filomicrobium sp.]CFX13561.1 putative Transcriptional regulator, LysR family [Candidatus Filomicrobium marinum]CPR17625.1 putative Transcriptional regulator, LysR family [Candidatus Filomicrobium marinum]